MKGKIVLVPFPFTDLTVAKLRPALVIHESAKDVVIAFISSKVPVEPSDTEVLLRKGRAGFERTGLKVDSVIRLDKVATVLKDLVVGELGEFEEDTRQEVNAKLAKIMRI